MKSFFVAFDSFVLCCCAFRHVGVSLFCSACSCEWRGARSWRMGWPGAAVVVGGFATGTCDGAFSRCLWRCQMRGCVVREVVVYSVLEICLTLVVNDLGDSFCKGNGLDVDGTWM